MGRAGSGGGGGGHSSGGHSSSRSSGGHRVSGRAGGGGRAGSGSSGGGYGHSHYHTHYHDYGGRGYVVHTGPSNPLTSAIALIVLVLMVAVVLYGRMFPETRSTRDRDKIDGGPYDTNCIVDDLYWFDNTTKVSTNLKSFYDKTGIQPYIVFREYDPDLITDAEKEEYALQYYDNYIDREDAFLFMYFAERDADNDVGFMCNVNGKQVDSVMDSEALEIFWGQIDKYWYSDMSTDKLITTAYLNTAKTIMTKSPSPVIFWVVVALIGGTVVILYLSIRLVKKKQEAQRERDAATERILSQRIEDL